MFKFYRIPLLKIIVLLVGIAAFVLGEYNGIALAIIYTLIAVGNGVAAHRYFGHHQFSVNRIGQAILAILATFAGYTSIHIWMAQHRLHHRFPDTRRDNHTPDKGFWHSFYTWQFKREEINYRALGFVSFYRDRTSVLAGMARDPLVTFLSRYFVEIWTVLLIALLLISPTVFFTYCIAHTLDTIRIGIINTCTHIKLPGSYRLYNTRDHSYNNLVIGLITFGFGWHNTHHGAPGKLILTECWWEIDLEGYIGFIFSKLFPGK